jgi:4a-hydroxytetrahydrobiopterin dehydratase
MKKLEIAEIENRLTNSWTFDGEFLVKDFKFKNFRKAFAFLAEIAIISETLKHHASIENVYNQVKLKLNTHDINGISELDFKFVDEVNKIYTDK